jgi:hypothetical protein
MPKAKKAETKMTNPKDAIGVKKVPMSCLSSQALALVAEAIYEENLRPEDLINDLDLSENFDAAVAHYMLFWEGSGDDYTVPHIARGMAHIMKIREFELADELHDERERIDTNGLHITELNAAAAAVIEKLPPSVAPFTNLAEGTLGFKVHRKITTDTQFHLLPWRVVMEMALGMMEGGIKYGRHNYRAVGVRASVYYDATMRHLLDYITGKPIDPDSNLSHLSKALSSSQVLLDSMVMGNWVDDRPIRIK